MFRKFSLPLLFLLISSVYFYTATNRAILDDGDALYAHVAQQMIQRGEWVTPYANGVRFLDKPPMMYWLMAMAYEAIGMTEFAARLPSMLAVIGTGLLLFYIGNRTGGHYSGFTAGVAAVFCIGTFLFTRMVFPDILFVFLLTLSLACFLDWYSDPAGPIMPAMLFYASLAGAMLTKGLIGVFFPVAIILLFLAWGRDWKRLLHFHLGKGTAIFLALALPWHLLVAWRNPGFLWYFFVNEQFLRFLGRRQPTDYESIPLPIFWGLMLLWLFPWSAFFPAIRTLLHLPGDRTSGPRAVVWLSLSWAVVVLVFFSLSSRIEHYALPAFPPLALLVGIALTPEVLHTPLADEKRHRWVGHGFSILAVLGAILGVIVLLAAVLWVSGWSRGQTLRDVAEHHLHAYKFYFGPLFDFPVEILARLEKPLLATISVFSAGLLGAWWANRRGSRTKAILVLCGTMMIFCVMAFQSIGYCEAILSSKQFGQQLSRLSRSGDAIISVGDYETANSLNFYLHAPFEVYGGTAAVLEWGLKYPDAPERILTRSAFEARWNSPGRAFLLVPDDRVKNLPLAGAFKVMNSAGRTLYCNQPPPD